MKRLTEKEIQEKLYGKYHRPSAPLAVKPEAPPMPEAEPKLEVQQELPLGLKEEKPAPLKKKTPKRKIAPPVKGVQPQPLASNQARLFVLSLLAVGLILLLFSLRPRGSSPKPIPIKSISKRDVPQTPLPSQPLPKRFTIQTIVYVKRAQAELFVQDLKQKNLEASIEEDASSKGQTRYLVLVGEFPTAGEAAKSLETFTRTYPELFRGSFVRKR